MKKAVLLGACLALTTTSASRAGGALDAVGKLGDAVCKVAGVARPVTSILGGLGLRLATPEQTLDPKGARSFKAVVVDADQVPGANVGDEVTINVTDPSVCGFSVNLPNSGGGVSNAGDKQLSPKGLAAKGGVAPRAMARPGLGEARAPVLEFQVDSMGRAVPR